MIIKSAEFLFSNTKLSELPPPTMPEYAFVGRSNVGKSSLINMLVNKKGMAKTSQTPGKTRLINHFIVNEKWYIVDLPGYGFAKVARTEAAAWKKMIWNYLEKRESLQCVCVLIDSRLEPQKVDLEFVESLGKKQIPFVLIFTKADKQSNHKSLVNIGLFKTEMFKTWTELPEMFLTSAENKSGRDEVLEWISMVNKDFVIPNLSFTKLI